MPQSLLVLIVLCVHQFLNFFLCYIFSLALNRYAIIWYVWCTSANPHLMQKANMCRQLRSIIGRESERIFLQLKIEMAGWWGTSSNQQQCSCISFVHKNNLHVLIFAASTRMVSALYILLHIHIAIIGLVIRLPVANYIHSFSSLLTINLFQVPDVHQTKTHHIIVPNVVRHTCSKRFVLLTLYKYYQRFQLSIQFVS